MNLSIKRGCNFGHYLVKRFENQPLPSKGQIPELHYCRHLMNPHLLQSMVDHTFMDCDTLNQIFHALLKHSCQGNTCVWPLYCTFSITIQMEPVHSIINFALLKGFTPGLCCCVMALPRSLVVYGNWYYHRARFSITSSLAARRPLLYESLTFHFLSLFQFIIWKVCIWAVGARWAGRNSHQAGEMAGSGY